MSFKHVVAVMTMTPRWTSTGQFATLALLANYADKTGLAYPSKARLAAQLKVSTRQVWTYTHELEALRLITIEPGTGPRGGIGYRVVLGMTVEEAGTMEADFQRQDPSTVEVGFQSDHHATVEAGFQSEGCVKPCGNLFDTVEAQFHCVKSTTEVQKFDSGSLVPLCQINYGSGLPQNYVRTYVRTELSTRTAPPSGARTLSLVENREIHPGDPASRPTRPASVAPNGDNYHNLARLADTLLDAGDVDSQDDLVIATKLRALDLGIRYDINNALGRACSATWYRRQFGLRRRAE